MIHFERSPNQHANDLCSQNSQTIQDASANASEKIRSAMLDVRHRMSTGKFEGLKDGLRYESGHYVVGETNTDLYHQLVHSAQ